MFPRILIASGVAVKDFFILLVPDFGESHCCLKCIEFSPESYRCMLQDLIYVGHEMGLNPISMFSDEELRTEIQKRSHMAPAIIEGADA